MLVPKLPVGGAEWQVSKITNYSLSVGWFWEERGGNERKFYCGRYHDWILTLFSKFQFFKLKYCMKFCYVLTSEWSVGSWVRIPTKSIIILHSCLICITIWKVRVCSGVPGIPGGPGEPSGAALAHSALLCLFKNLCWFLFDDLVDVSKIPQKMFFR